MDIVERIRKYDCSDGGHSDAVGGTIYELAEEAACEIERLRSQITKADYLLNQGAPTLALEALQ